MNRKIKILFTTPNFDTAGSGQALLNIASRLDKKYFEPEICCMHNGGELFKSVSKSGIPIHIFTYTRFPKQSRISMLVQIYKTVRFFRKAKPDIIHSFHYADDYSEALAARIAGVPWVFTKKNMSWGSNGWLLKNFFANGVIATNEDIYVNFFKKKNKSQLILRGIETDKFVLPDTPVFNQNIVSVGAILPIKGTETLVKAFEKIYNHCPSARLFFVGNDTTDYAVKIKSYIREKGLKDRVVFTGQVNNVKDYLDQSTFFVMSSNKKGEGGPQALLEAMAKGKYVLGTDVAGIRDQLKNFPELLFEPENPDCLAERLISALQLSQNEVVKKGHRLREEILSRFTIEREVREHQDFYLRILKSSNIGEEKEKI